MKSETHLHVGALAYWGEFYSREDAEREWREQFASDPLVAIVEVPAP